MINLNWPTELKSPQKKAKKTTNTLKKLRLKYNGYIQIK